MSEAREAAYKGVIWELERIIHARTPGFIRPKPLTLHEVEHLAKLLSSCHDEEE